MKKIQILFSAIFILFFSLFANAQKEQDFEISKNIDVFCTMYNVLNKNYVDDLKHGELFETAIVSLLKTLDPYTVYIPESDIEKYKLMQTGEYGGIGSEVRKVGDSIYIAHPYKGFPADNVGLKAGDIILEVDGQITKGKSITDVSDIMKGSPKTTVNIKYNRRGVINSVDIERDKVKRGSIPYYGMLNDSIGYIKLNSFTQGVSGEIKKAFVEMQKEGMQGFILDLRSNGGGLLIEAVKIVNIFVPENKTVVYTKGKLDSRNKTYKTREKPIDLDIPIVVLVNGHSASASEIVCGAIQDMDRGVLIGQKTYGKGLVQNILPLSYNSQMKVTTAKYYIPSGRCIQAIDYSSDEKTKISDSLMTVFYTENGREVKDAGGVLPDIITDVSETSDILVSLVINNHFFFFANNYVLDNPISFSAKEFVMTDSIYNDFLSYLEGKDLHYELASEKLLKEFEKSLDDEGIENAKEQIEALNTLIQLQKDNDLQEHKGEISDYLRNELAQRYFYKDGALLIGLQFDNDVKDAINLIYSSDKYKKILEGNN